MLKVSEEGNPRREGFVSSYKQLCLSLLDLQDASDQIFTIISQRTAKERNTLSNLSARIQNVKDRINALSQSKEKIKVRSSSKYPSDSRGREDFESLFGYSDVTSGVLLPVKNVLVNGGLSREFGIDGTLELFQFFSESTSEILPVEVQSEISMPASRARGIPSIENLINSPTCLQRRFIIKDPVSPESSLKHKSKTLPPPPPSLLLHQQRFSKPGRPNFISLKQGSTFKLSSLLQPLTRNVGIHSSDIDDLVSKTGIIHDDHPTIDSVTVEKQKSTQLSSSLPAVGSQRAALLASIRSPGIVLRKPRYP